MQRLLYVRYRFSGFVDIVSIKLQSRKRFYSGTHRMSLFHQWYFQYLNLLVAFVARSATKDIISREPADL